MWIQLNYVIVLQLCRNIILQQENIALFCVNKAANIDDYTLLPRENSVGIAWADFYGFEG